MSSINSIFEKLNLCKSTLTGTYFFSDIPNIKHHKLGITSDGCPIYFIKCDDKESNFYPSYNLGVEVDFGVDCRITDGRNVISGKFTLVSLKKDSLNLLPYFLDVVMIILKSIPPNSKRLLVKSEIDNLTILFSNMQSEGTGDIQGSWAELLVIERSKNPDYLLSSWHESKTSLFDFNNGSDKLEVKSTQNSDRKHSFSLNQLVANKSSNLIICSVIVSSVGQGKNVFDMLDLIHNRVQDQKLLIKLNSIFTETLGNKVAHAQDIYFDYATAKDSIKFFDVNDIPSLNIKVIPPEITNVHFDCNLRNVKASNIKKFKSKLYKSL